MTDNMIYAPFIGILPTPTHAKDVVAPPYDVLNADEAKIKAQGNPLSFLHISKAEIDLPSDISPYDEQVYAQASKNFQTLLQQNILQKTQKPCYYIYQMTMGTHTQTGLAVSASVKAYNEGRIKRHELTRIVKENDRVKQIRTVGAQTGPALLINKNIPEIKKLLSDITTQSQPYFSVIGDNEVLHSVWIIDDDTQIQNISEAFGKQNEAYIADGHHRSAAASRLASEDNTEDSSRFLAMAFFAEEMRIMDYNRFVHDLNGMTEAEFISALKADFKVTPTENSKPTTKGTFTMYLGSQWYNLEYIGTPIGTDPVSTLDVSILSQKVLDNLLNIKDLRNDERIEFVGGIRGPEEISRLVNNLKGSVGFMVCPTSVEELLAVADCQMLMPPKSTWFEPKLADGLISK